MLKVSSNWAHLLDLCALFDKSGIDDIWHAVNLARESVTENKILLLFRTSNARIKQVIEFEERNDMIISQDGTRQVVEAEDSRLKTIKKW